MKTTYITWHYTTHGTAYLKHIISKFYIYGLDKENISCRELNQIELNDTFSMDPTEKGFLFDEIIYLTAPQHAFDNLSSRRFSYMRTILEDDFVQKKGLTPIFEEIIDNIDIRFNLDKVFEYVKTEHPTSFENFQSALWRDIQHYPIHEQLKWLKEYSNFKNYYPTNFKAEELNVDDLRNEKLITDEVSKWANNYFSKNKNIQPIINVSLGSNETQVVWHILAQSGRLPDSTRFIKTYDDKSDNKNERFKEFSIIEIPTNLISKISDEFKIYTETKSQSRNLVNKQMEVFLKTGFSILLIGERGIGKSLIASNAKDRLKELNKAITGELVEANCASFANEYMAESELFGHTKGSFTDAKQDKKGLIESAENGILFLDEIHHLSIGVQAKLMKALQTDQHNRLSIRRVGSQKEQLVKNVRLIFATNKSVEELKDLLLPDFYDRIVQHVINIPPLRETLDDRLSDWKTVWKGLKFSQSPSPPEEHELISWLKQLQLYGNYRDLQKIAMYYNAFNNFDDETKKMLEKKSALQYAQTEFEKYHSGINKTKTNDSTFEFSMKKSATEIEADFKYFLQDWAVKKYGSRKSAAAKLEASEKTLNDWKNRKSLQNKK